MKRLVLNAAGVGAVALNSLLIWPVAGRVVESQLVGTLAAQLAWSGIIATSVSLGLNILALYAGEQGQDWRYSLNMLCARVILLCMLFAGVLGLVDLVVGRLYLATLAAGLAQGALLIYQGLARGLHRLWMFAGLAFFSQAGSLAACTVAARLTGSADISLLVFAIATAVCAFFAWPLWAKPRAERSSEVRGLLVRSLALVPGSLLYVAIPMGARVGVYQLGGYSEAFSFQYVAIIGTAAPTFMAALAPMFLLGQKRVRSLWQLATVALGGYVIFVVVLAPFWVPPKADHSLVLGAMAVLAMCIPLQPMTDRAGYYLVTKGQTAIMSTGMLIGAVLGAFTFFGSLTFFPAAWAGALALLVSAFGRTGALMYFARSNPRVPHEMWWAALLLGSSALFAISYSQIL